MFLHIMACFLDSTSIRNRIIFCYNWKVFFFFLVLLYNIFSVCLDCMFQPQVCVWHLKKWNPRLQCTFQPISDKRKLKILLKCVLSVVLKLRSTCTIHDPQNKWNALLIRCVWILVYANGYFSERCIVCNRSFFFLSTAVRRDVFNTPFSSSSMNCTYLPANKSSE